MSNQEFSTEDEIKKIAVASYVEAGYDVTTAQKIFSDHWPKIEMFPKGDGEYQFVVTPARLANLTSCILAADTNILIHTGSRAITQTLVIIAVCAAVASRLLPGYRLAAIRPEIKFEAAVPAHAPIMVVAIICGKPKKGGKVAISGYFGEGFTRTLFEYRQITMIRV